MYSAVFILFIVGESLCCSMSVFDCKGLINKTNKLVQFFIITLFRCTSLDLNQINCSTSDLDIDIYLGQPKKLAEMT